MKRHDTQIRQALENEKDTTPPEPLHIPLPTWSGLKSQIEQQRAARRSACEERSRLWEQEEKVLGHTARADISKPRNVLSVDLTDEDTRNGKPSPCLL